jgi:transcriptional regulator with XRE-family HTH domain
MAPNDWIFTFASHAVPQHCYAVYQELTPAYGASGAVSTKRWVHLPDEPDSDAPESAQSAQETAPSADGVQAAMDSIGERLRTLRTSRGIGVRELARRVGVTPSLLSQMERGSVNPSVVTLFRLAEALDTTTDYFFGEGRGPQSAHGPVVRRGERARISLSGGITWERLTPTDEHDFEFMECMYPPGATSAREMQRHPGRDYGILLEGQLIIDVGFASYHLHPGDSIAFDASLPHRLTNPGDVPARTIWVVLERNRPPG